MRERPNRSVSISSSFLISGLYAVKSWTALIAASAALLVASCSAGHERVETFALECENPGSVELFEEPGVKPEKEGTLLAGERFEHGMPATPLYRSGSTVHVSKDSALLFIYSAETETEALVFSGEIGDGKAKRSKQVHSLRLPATGGEKIGLMLGLDGKNPAAFQIRAVDGDTSDSIPKFSLEAVSLVPEMRGVRVQNGIPVMSGGIGGWRSLGGGESVAGEGGPESEGGPQAEGGIGAGQVVISFRDEASGASGNGSVSSGEAFGGASPGAEVSRFHQERIEIAYSYREPARRGQQQDQRRQQPDRRGQQQARGGSSPELQDSSPGGEEGKDGEEYRDDRPEVLLTVAAGGSAEYGGARDEGASSGDVVERRRTEFKLHLNEGRNSVYLYSDMLGFAPRHVEVSVADVDGFSVEAVELNEVAMYAEDTPEPLDADIGAVLRYGREHWRRSDWELFSWNLFPDILIFDFRDYALQSSFLKRLAFFVEKEGYTGDLHPNEVLDELHGWNAHDYRAEDLARFFSLAVGQDFELNPQERLLVEILQDNGIIRKRGNSYEPGKGGIISVSQESSYRLRYLFLIHEGYHGFYFTSAEYRRRVADIWAKLSEDEKAFWRYFLEWRSYNTDDPYLMENEFQAYLMQQHISHVNSYYKGYIIPRYITLFPEREEPARDFLEQYPDHFIENARKLEAAARETAGVTAGDLLCLRKLD